MKVKDNPKHIQALKDGKAPLEYLVSTMDELDAAVHKHGADKYGVLNWRVDKITAKTYVGAMRRHLKAWSEGQDLDPESGRPHLTHLRACCAVVLDAQMFGTLIDNRLEVESKSVQLDGPQPGAGSTNIDHTLAVEHQEWCVTRTLYGRPCDCKPAPVVTVDADWPKAEPDAKHRRWCASIMDPSRKCDCGWSKHPAAPPAV